MAKHEDRGVRDQAGIGPDPIQPDRLVSMDDVDDFKIADGEPDLRGWDVYSSTGVFVGEVDDLLIDPELRQVVMLDIDLKDSATRGRAPVKAAWLDHDRRRVIIDSAQLDQGMLEHRSRQSVVTEEVVVVDRPEQVDVITSREAVDTRPLRDPAETRPVRDPSDIRIDERP